MTQTNLYLIVFIVLTDLKPGPFNCFYPAFKAGLTGGQSKQLKNWKAASVFSKIDKKANTRVYHKSRHANITNNSKNDRSQFFSNQSRPDNYHNQSSYRSSHEAMSRQFSRDSEHNNILSEHNCLIIGGGPCGLRTAIELQLLGSSHVVVVEKRDRFSRNNVIHLWPFVIQDLKQMAGKKFYGKFCAGK